MGIVEKCDRLNFKGCCNLFEELQGCIGLTTLALAEVFSVHASNLSQPIKS